MQANWFPTFAEYQNVTGATDEQLAFMLSSPCAEIGIGNFEDAMSEALTRWLRHITGIEWVRGWENGARPLSQQYGTIWLQSFSPFSAGVRSYGYPENETDICETVTLAGSYRWQLDVWGDSGTGNRGQAPATPRREGSAIDQLMWVRARMLHSLFKRALADKAMHYADNALSQIINVPPETVNGTYRHRASAVLEIRACPSSSHRVQAMLPQDISVVVEPCTPPIDPPPTQPC